MHNSNHNINSNKDITNHRDGNRTTFGGAFECNMYNTYVLKRTERNFVFKCI